MGSKDDRHEDHYTAEEQISEAKIGAPHLVILGAGASRQAFPTGDAMGKRLPLMNSLVQDVGLESVLLDHGVNVPPGGLDFETLFSDLHESGSNDELRFDLEDEIRAYFSLLELPSEPTLYDYLLLSLTEKDVVATFNWDPLLWQAANRNSRHAPLPHLVFLHGSAAIGVCQACKVKGDVRDRCRTCDTPFRPSKLLYPVKSKSYRSDPHIKAEWECTQWALERAFVLTIFGYGAPVTDAAALELIKQGWSRKGSREVEQVEVELIDIRSRKDLRASWGDFIVRDHYSVTTDFYRSIAARFPRRSCDAVWNRVMALRQLVPNSAPKDASFEELWDWHDRYLPAERRAWGSGGAVVA